MKTKMDPVADLLGSGRIVSYKADFAHLTGSITAGLLLSQFWYFSSLPTALHRDGWFYLTMDEISEQTGMIREEQVTARERLKALGILEEKRQGVPAQLWFRLDKERLYELLREYAAKKEALLQDAGIPQSGKATRQSAGIPQSVVREFRRLVRGIVTGKSVENAESITKDFSESSSIEFSGDGEIPPINPPQGEDADAPLPDATATPAEVVWSQVKSLVKGKVSEAVYGCHVTLLRFVSIDPTTTGEALTATLEAPNAWSRDYVEKRGAEALQAAFQQATGRVVTVAFVAGGK